MAAIITDQIRILNAKNFVSKINSDANSYYSFINNLSFNNDKRIHPEPTPISNKFIFDFS